MSNVFQYLSHSRSARTRKWCVFDDVGCFFPGSGGYIVDNKKVFDAILVRCFPDALDAVPGSKSGHLKQ